MTLPHLPPISYYEAMYVRKGAGKKMLAKDAIAIQREHARRLASATIVDPPASDPPQK